MLHYQKSSTSGKATEKPDSIASFPYPLILNIDPESRSLFTFHLSYFLPHFLSLTHYEGQCSVCSVAMLVIKCTKAYRINKPSRKQIVIRCFKNLVVALKC